VAAKAEYTFIWYSALAAPYGIVVETDNPEALKARLYAARAESQDPDLANISIKTSPFNPSQLWLIKRQPDAPDSDEA